MTNLASLYAEYKKNLKKNDLVMQDDILSIPLQIEAIVRGFVGPVKISDAAKSKYQDAGPLRGSLEYEASVIHELIGKDFTTYDLLEGIENRQKEVRNILSEKPYKEICEGLGITYRLHTDGKDRPFVPTKGKDKAPITGSGTGWEKEKKSPKLLELIGLLGRIETPEGGRIDTRDILVDFQSETPDSMMRTLPYVVVRIPRLSRTILIDDRIGEATFVLQGLTDLSIIASNHKGELETHHGARKVIYDAKWKENLTKYLITDWNKEGKEEKNTPTPRVDVDRASLFMDVETIRVNLEAFAKIAGIKIEELDISPQKNNIEAILSNGVTMKWDTFLRNASQYILGTEKRSQDNPHRRGSALDIMFKLIGRVRVKKIGFLTKEYFQESNREAIKKDLEVYAEASGVRVEELSSATPKGNTEVTLSNGVRMKWNTFLLNASQYILGTEKRSQDNPHRRSDALNALYRIVGIEIEKKHIEKEYFQESNRVVIKKDLEAYGKSRGIKVEELPTSKSPIDIILSNEVRMKWDTFLRNASQYILGTENNSKENPHRKSEALDKLCEIVGVKRVKKY